MIVTVIVISPRFLFALLIVHVLSSPCYLCYMLYLSNVIYIIMHNTVDTCIQYERPLCSKCWGGRMCTCIQNEWEVTLSPPFLPTMLVYSLLLVVLSCAQTLALSCWCNVQTADLLCTKTNASLTPPPNAYGVCSSSTPNLACMQRITWPWPQEYSCEINEAAKDGLLEYSVLNGQLHTYIHYCAEDRCGQVIHPATCSWKVAPMHSSPTSLVCACNTPDCNHGSCDFKRLRFNRGQFGFCRHWRDIRANKTVQDCHIEQGAEDRKVFVDGGQELLLCRDEDNCNDNMHSENIFRTRVHCPALHSISPSTSETTVLLEDTRQQPVAVVHHKQNNKQLLSDAHTTTVTAPFTTSNKFTTKVNSSPVTQLLSSSTTTTSIITTKVTEKRVVSLISSGSEMIVCDIVLFVCAICILNDSLFVKL